jgi:hypothetical protein
MKYRELESRRSENAINPIPAALTAREKKAKAHEDPCVTFAVLMLKIVIVYRYKYKTNANNLATYKQLFL